SARFGAPGWGDGILRVMANEIARKLRKNMARHEVRLQLRLRELRKLGFISDDRHPSRVSSSTSPDGSQHSRRRQELKDAARDLALGADDFRIIACGMRTWKRI